MPQKGHSKRYQNDIKINAIKKKYESDVEVAETEMDTSAVNSSSIESDNEDMDRSDPLTDTEPCVSNHAKLCDYMNFKILKSKNEAVISLENDSKFYFKGKLSIKVLKGKLEILGSTLTHHTEEFVSVYSPRGYSLLYCHGFRDESDQRDITEVLASEGLAGDESLDFSSHDCVILARKLEEEWCQFLTEQMNRSKHKMNLLQRDTRNLPPDIQTEGVVAEVERALDINLISCEAGGRYARKLAVGEGWELAVQSAQLTTNNGLQPRLVVAGGKGVGKSTFLRWLTNQLLPRSPVVVLDLDPGQAELSIPGYFSVSLVTAPFLGPNFQHIGTSNTQMLVFLGDISAGNCPDRFIKILHRLSDYIQTNLSGYPLVVNTMGWCQGVGLMLLVDTLRLLQPSTVIQLTSKHKRKNFPYSLSPDRVSGTRDSWRSARTKLTYNLLELAAVPESAAAPGAQDFWGLPDPRALREIALVSWLGRTGWPWPVYRVPLSSLTLGVAVGVTRGQEPAPATLLAAANNSLVDLCHVRERDRCAPKDRPELYSVLARPVYKPSLGVGFVRNIDPGSAVLYLATYVPASQLAQVNCLLVGALQLPSSVLAEAAAARRKGDPPPYLGRETSNPLDASWQRYHKPR